MAKASNKAVNRLDGSAHGSLTAFTPCTAFTSRGLGVQDGLILARVQVPPLPLWLMVIQLASRSTFWARPLDHVVVSQVNVDFAGLQLQFHRVHKPGNLDTQNAPIKLMILHPRHYRRPPVGDAYPLRTLNSLFVFRTFLRFSRMTMDHSGGPEKQDNSEDFGKNYASYFSANLTARRARNGLRGARRTRGDAHARDGQHGRARS